MTELGGAAGSWPFAQGLPRRSALGTTSRRRPERLRWGFDLRGVARRVGRGAATTVAVLAFLIIVGVATNVIRPVVTHGTSMLPTYQAGDLVIIAKASTYELGAIAAYQNPDADEVVLHRIVGGDPVGGYEMRGDNNASIDPLHPTLNQLLGRPVAHVPRIGRIVQSPVALVGVLGSLAALAVVGIGLTRAPTTGGRARGTPRRARARPSRHRRLLRPPRDSVEQPNRRPSPSTSSLVVGLLLVADLALAIALTGAVLMPPTAVAPPPVTTQRLTLQYGAAVPASVTYPSGRIVTGDTAFRRLTDHLDVVATYRTSNDGDPAAPEPTGGNLRLDAVIEAAAGWRTTIPLSTAPLGTAASGAGPAEVVGTIALTTIDELLARMTAETGISATTATITITASADPLVPIGEPTPSALSINLQFTAESVAPIGKTALGEHNGSPAVETEVPLVAASVDAPPAEGGVPLHWRRTLLILLLASVALTAVAWPSPSASRIVAVGALRGGTSLTRIRMNDADALDEIADYEGAPVLEGDGWRAVLADQRMYWSGDRPPDLVDT